MVLDAMGRTRQVMAAVAACVLLILQGWMLEHNLEVWRETSELARSVCVAFGQVVAGASGGVVVRGLPATRNGTVFLQNGFPQCVEMNAGVPAGRIQVQSESGANEFVWNEAAGRIEAAPSH